MRIKIFNIITFIVLWFCLNGLNNRYFAFATVFITYIIASKLALIPKKFKLSYKFFSYLLWLSKEIIKSSFRVIKIVWSYKMNITPTFEWVESKQTEDIGLVIYGNSITLTPGTVTLDVRHGMLLVHALEAESVKELQNNNNLMDMKICQAIH